MTKYQTTIKTVGGKRCIYKINAKLHSIKRSPLRKKGEINEGKIRENIRKVDDHWNNWKFQLHWNKLEWVYPKTRDRWKNPFYSSTRKFCIKDVNNSSRFVGHYKLEPIDYVAFFKIKDRIDALT